MKFNILKSVILLLLLCFISSACEKQEEENGYTIKVDNNFLESHQKAAYFISEDFSNTVIKQGIIQNGRDIRILLEELGEIPYSTYTFSYLMYDNKVEKSKYRMYSYYGVSLNDIKLFSGSDYVPRERSEKETQVKLNCTTLGQYHSFGNQEDGLGIVNSNYYTSIRNRRIGADEEDGIFTISRTEFPERKEDFAYAIKKVRPNQLTEYNCEDFIVGQKTDYVDFDFASYLLQTDYSYQTSIYGMTDDGLIEYGGHIQSSYRTESIKLRHKSWYPKEFIETKHNRFLIGLSVADRSEGDDKAFSNIYYTIQSPTVLRSISLAPINSQLEPYHYFGDLDIEQSGNHFQGYVVLKSRNEEYEWLAVFPNKRGVTFELPELSQEIQAYLSIEEFNKDLYIYAKSARYDERYDNNYATSIRFVFSDEDLVQNTGTKAYWTVYKRFYENFEGEIEEQTPLFDPLKEF